LNIKQSIENDEKTIESSNRTIAERQASLAKLVKVGGMSDETFATCMRDEALRKRLLEGAFQGQRDYGVDSTPTFFINGVKLVGARPYEEFAKELSAAEAKPKS
jgi:predicted DsbA family dithiol-disulfide isomerase